MATKQNSKISTKLSKSFGEKVAESYFNVFQVPGFQGPNFSWEWFIKDGLPGLIETQLIIKFGDSKNWKKHLSSCIKAGQAKCKELFKENNIKIGSWYVYILRCADDTLYTGITNDLQKRIQKHNEGKGAKYTRGRGPVALVRSFICHSKGEALKLEYKIKKLPRDQKLNFLRED